MEQADYYNVGYSIYLYGTLSLICLFALANKVLRSILISQSYDDLYVLITGCDTGFGYRCAIKLDRLGFNVFAACLTQEKVKDLTMKCSNKMTSLQMDVTCEKSVREAFHTVRDKLPDGRGLWAIINNAGVFGSFGACEWFGKSDYQETINVNLLGMVSVINTFLPLVRKCKGRIVNMASVVGRFAIIPAPYSVSKFCVEAYTDCLRRELVEMGISVHTVEPGGYQTNITDCDIHSKTMDSVFEKLSPDLQEFYGVKFKDKLLHLVRLFFSILVSRGLDEVVDTYIHAITARFPKTRYIVGFNGRFMFWPLALMPTWLSDMCKKSLGKVASTQKQIPHANVGSSKSLKDLYHNDVNIKYPEPKATKDRAVKGSKSKGLQSVSHTNADAPAAPSTSRIAIHQDDSHRDSDSHDESPRPESSQAYSSPPSHSPLPSSPAAPVATTQEVVEARPNRVNQILLVLAYVVVALLACFILVTFVKCWKLQSSIDAHQKKRGR
ncbi:Retinol dehydrogenase 7 [Bulinus truncatus]|nr:Retinol dehydrogenase 7 [Bulinus truncatus]